MKRVAIIWLIVMGFVVGCAVAEEPSNAEMETALSTAVVSSPLPPTPTAPLLPSAIPSQPASPTSIPTSEPLPDTPEPLADTPTPPPPLFTYGRTAEGAFFRGNPDADVVLIDYSDFL